MSHPGETDESSHALVVTFDPKLSAVVSAMLESAGYAVIVCDDPGHLAARTADSSPAVIVVDEAMAKKNPLELCRTIREIPGCNFVPLLLLSGDQSEEATERAYDENVTAVIAKPIDPDDFRKHIHSLGDTGRTISGIRILRSTHTAVFRTMPDAFFIVGNDGLLRQYLGGANDDPVLSPEEIEGQNINDVWPPYVAKVVMQSIKRVLRSRDAFAFEIELHRDSEKRSYEARLLVQGRDKVLLVLRDVSSVSGSGIRAQEADSNDTLTGLTTRDVFMSHFESLIADAKLRERGVAVFCIDIDRFSRINSTLGRQVGDAVLKVTAQRIERCLRASDKLARIDDDVDSSSLTRIGGDEFVLVLADIESREDVSTVAGRVQESFAEPVSIEGHMLKVSPSIGITMYPLDGDNPTDLLKNARVALDEAKVLSAEGREFYSSTMKYRAQKRLDVKNELRWAIEKEQLELHYLPRIDLVSGDVAGLEALLRWIHPLRGSVPLSEVIPLAEATGLIFPIGEWVLETACRQAAEWHQEELDVPVVSVNLSQQEFARDDLVELVTRSLEKSGLPANHLELELTEGMLMRNRQVDSTLRELNELGVGIVLDDFGQGHSSIANLTSRPIKAIKIDRAFINGVREPGEKQAICSAMIAMAKELGITVIAEGVESHVQVEFLRERGCDAVQGFLYTEPLPVDKVPTFLQACDEVLDKTSVVDLGTVRQKIAIKTRR